MDKNTIDANNLDAQGLPLDLRILRMDSDIARVYNQYKLKTIENWGGLGLSDTEATMANVFARLPNNTIFMTEVYRGTQVNFDMPKFINGNTMSGRLTVYGSVEAVNKISAYFQNEYGLWVRHQNKSSGAPYIDSGWHKIPQAGLQEWLTAGSVTALGGFLSNLKTPGEYYATAAIMSSFSDAPTTGGSKIDVEFLIENSDTLQKVRLNAAPQSEWYRQIGNSSGATAWYEVMIAGHTLTTTSAFNFAGGTTTGTLSSSTITPRTANSYDLGSTPLPFRNIYSQNAVTIVSDREYKEQIGEIPDEALDAWATINYSQWKMKSAVALKGPDDARLHVGIIAQEIKEAFEAAGLDATAYGILIYDSWGAVEPVEYQPAVYDHETNEVITPEVQAVEGREAGEIWMVRMEECLAFEAALMRRTTKRFEERLAALETK